MKGFHVYSQKFAYSIKFIILVGRRSLQDCLNVITTYACRITSYLIIKYRSIVSASSLAREWNRRASGLKSDSSSPAIRCYTLERRYVGYPVAGIASRSSLRVISGLSYIVGRGETAAALLNRFCWRKRGISKTRAVFCRESSRHLLVRQELFISVSSCPAIKPPGSRMLQSFFSYVARFRSRITLRRRYSRDDEGTCSKLYRIICAVACRIDTLQLYTFVAPRILLY